MPMSGKQERSEWIGMDERIQRNPSEISSRRIAQRSAVQAWADSWMLSEKSRTMNWIMRKNMSRFIRSSH